MQRELEVLSEQYSQKCLENAHLAQALEAERQALRQCQRENQELNAHNQVSRPSLGVQLTASVPAHLPVSVTTRVAQPVGLGPPAAAALPLASGDPGLSVSSLPPPPGTLPASPQDRALPRSSSSRYSLRVGFCSLENSGTRESG